MLELDGFHPLADVLAFLEVGGFVLVTISVAIVIMWTLIFERAWYFRRMRREGLPQLDLPQGHQRERVLEHAIQVRYHGMTRRLPLIRALVSVCPLLGLLGTVWGMIEVFEVTALRGGGNVRAIAAGVSTATVTTMAGLVASLSGMLLLAWLDRFVANEHRRDEQQLGEG